MEELETVERIAESMSQGKVEMGITHQCDEKKCDHSYIAKCSTEAL